MPAASSYDRRARRSESDFHQFLQSWNEVAPIAPAYDLRVSTLSYQQSWNKPYHRGKVFDIDRVTTPPQQG